MNMRKLMRRDLWLAGAAGTCVAMAGALSPTAVLAQTAAPAAEAAQAYKIPAGPLSAALNSFADQSGLALVYPASLTTGLRTEGFNGRSTVREVMARLLAGTGLSFRFLNAKTITVEPPPVAGARTLGAVQVEGVQTDAFAALDGFGAGVGSNGSSDPTATEGTGSLTTNGATIASKTPLALKDTPQSVTVITAERIEEQNLTDLTSALEYTPGVTLASLSNAITTTFYSRGFQLTTFQFDGGAPMDLNFNSVYATTPNLAEFDNIQVLRGSDALFGGAGQPSGVVSLDRRRPLDHEQFLGEADVGSWDNYQAQVDVTGPLGFDGHLRGRIVLTEQDRDFFYETAHQTKTFAYGVLEADLGPQTILRIGGSFEQQNNTGWNANGLPRYSDGGDLNLPRSTNLAAPWSYYNFRTPELFATLEHRFNSDWNLKLNFTRLSQTSTSKFNSAANSVIRGSATEPAYGETTLYQDIREGVQHAGDATLNGAFDVFSLRQTVTVGADYSLSQGSMNTYLKGIKVPINIFKFNPNSLNPEPAQPPLFTAQPTDTQTQWGQYVTVNLQPIKNLHLIGGVRVSGYSTATEDDYYLGLPTPLFVQKYSHSSSGNLTPYAAVTYAVTSQVSLYASYADVFQVQAGFFDPAGKPLPPVAGVTDEAGIKGAFNGGKLNASLSVYYTDESNQYVAASGPCADGFPCYLDTGAVISEGVDLEISGEILPGWQAQGGYTYNKNHYNQALVNAGDNDGFPTYNSQQPEHQFKLWTAYTPTGRFDRLTVGGGFRLESARFAEGNTCSVPLTPPNGTCSSGVYLPFAYTQPLYTVLDLRVAYKLNDHWQAALDITNVGDTRYYSTTANPVGLNFYGEPRAVMFSIRAKY